MNFRSRLSSANLFVFLLAVMFLVLGIFHLTGIIPPVDQKGKETSPFVGPGLVFFSIAIFIAHAYRLRIIMLKEGVLFIRSLFKARRILKDDINTINLFATENDSEKRLGTALNLINGETVFITDDDYRNIYQFKEALSQDYKEKIEPYPVQKKDSEFSYLITAEKFAGNPHISFNGLVLYGFALFLIYLALFHGPVKPVHSVFIGLYSILLWGLGAQMYYFELSSIELTVKNHVFFWFKRSYGVNDIAVVNNENYHRRSDGIRITTKDFKSRFYHAGSLRNKHWAALKERLRNFGVPFI